MKQKLVPWWDFESDRLKPEFGWSEVMWRVRKLKNSHYTGATKLVKLFHIIAWEAYHTVFEDGFRVTMARGLLFPSSFMHLSSFNRPTSAWGSVLSPGSELCFEWGLALSREWSTWFCSCWSVPRASGHGSVPGLGTITARSSFGARFPCLICI